MEFSTYNDKRFQPCSSFAGILQPGDKTRYEMVVVEDMDTYIVVVLNEWFFDKIIFLKRDFIFYKTFREDSTNPWTIKAAKEMIVNWKGDQVNVSSC